VPDTILKSVPRLPKAAHQQTYHLVVHPLVRQQLRMIPRLQHPPRPQHKNDIRILDRRQPMRHGDNRQPTRCRTLNGLLHQLLRLGVEIRRRLVEEQQLWPAEKCARQSNALPLAAAEGEPFGADERRVAVRKGGDEVVDLGGSAGFVDGVVCGFGVFDGERYVLSDCA
jgi:hypothetical protein